MVGRSGKRLKLQLWGNDGPLHRTGTRRGGKDCLRGHDAAGCPRRDLSSRERLRQGCGYAHYADRGAADEAWRPCELNRRDTHVNIYLEPFLNVHKGWEFKLPTEVNGNVTETLRKRGPLVWWFLSKYTWPLLHHLIGWANLSALEYWHELLIFLKALNSNMWVCVCL